MRSSNFLLLCALLALPAALARGQDSPAISGYVTRAVSASDFDVNTLRVLCTGRTRGVSKSVHGATDAAVACPGEPPVVGEGMVVHYTGEINEANAIYATRIERQRVHTGDRIDGSAVIDAAPGQESAGSQGAGFLVQADGYRIRITGGTKCEWTPPLQSLGDVKAGDWINYKGKLDAGGVLVAATVKIGPNTIGSGEERLRTKKEYDPSAVPADARQNYLKDAVHLGFDPKEFRPFTDAAMQARVQKIGNSLVPVYQRGLPDSDPAKIDFRFQVIDTKRLSDAFTLPNGIVLIPHQVVERTRNDSQLAALLADGIARVLERQEYRTEWKIKAGYASAVASPFVPYAGLGMGTGGQVAEEIQTKEMEQRDRVSLVLLRDAGYDMDQVPMAWWLLALDPKDPTPIGLTEVPPRAVYLYRILGEVWHSPNASADASAKP